MIHLFQDRVLIRHEKEPETTDSGLFIPETGIPMELGIWAEVMVVGPGRLLEGADAASKLIPAIAGA